MPDKRPNIVYVFADQFRGCDIGVAGNKEVITPNLDRLAAEGTRFTHAYANAPVCTPSRAMLLTGRYPLSNRVIANDLPLPEGSTTIASLLSKTGYRTGYIGKWHLDGVPRNRFTPPGPARQGFDFWAAYNCSHNYYRPDKYFLDVPEPVMVEGYEPTIQTDLAIQFLQRQDQRPFCLFLSWGPPHDPYDQVPERFRAMYDPNTLTLRGNVTDVADNPLARGLNPRRTMANYYAAITALDDELGRLMNALEESRHIDDTILVFSSDHGDMLWSHGWMKKQQPWEESIGIPFVARWPGHIPAGVANGGLFSIIDVCQTLLALADVDPDPGMQGADRSRLWLGDQAAGADSVFLMDLVSVDESRLQGVPEWRGVRTPKWTYAETVAREPWLLIDNDNDAWQLHNLVDDDASAAVLADLQSILQVWLEKTGDSFATGLDNVRKLGLIDAWNAREMELEALSHGRLKARLLGT